MSWEDRDYNREEDDAGGPSLGGMFHRLFHWLNASIPAGTYFNIAVRIHVTLVALLVIQVAATNDILWTLRWFGLLFVSVLLHEFGHCLACRSVGGEADEILLWPLGGLAFCVPPRRPWAAFVTVAGGPLVTLALTLIPLVLLTVVLHAPRLVGLNPASLWAMGGVWGVQGLLHDLYMVNYSLLLFNLLLMFPPFDGGRMAQIGLWKLVGYDRSMRWATAIGMAGAGAVALYAVVTPELLQARLLLVLLAIFGFISCFREREALAQDAADGPSFDPGYYDQQARPARPGRLERWRRQRRAHRALKLEQALRQEEAQVDAILAKVKASGMASLSDGEKKILQRATERYQKTR